MARKMKTTSASLPLEVFSVRARRGATGSAAARTARGLQRVRCAFFIRGQEALVTPFPRLNMHLLLREHSIFNLQCSLLVVGPQQHLIILDGSFSAVSKPILAR